MRYTLGQAAKATGLHKTRLSRAIKHGVISATKTENGGYLIDPAELHRVFPMVTAPPSPATVAEGPTRPQEMEPLLRLQAAETRLADKDDVIRDLRHRLDDASQERQRLTLLLTHQTERTPPPKSFWARLFA
jgi:hypothetical protein